MPHSGYWPRIEDSWVPALFYCPRWFAANLYEDIADPLPLPDNTNFDLHTIYVNPINNVVPAQWVLTTYTPQISSYNLLQRMMEIFTHELEYFNLALTTLSLQNSRWFDTSDPQNAWLVTFKAPITDIQVLLSNNQYQPIQQALGEHDLFWVGDWRWVGRANSALIYGLNIQQQLTENRVDNWQFVSGVETWDSGSVTFFEHPVTKNWIPIHPLYLRSDGFLDFYYEGQTRIRNSFFPAASALTTLNVLVNGVSAIATLVDLWNTVDEYGLKNSIERLEYESNDAYGNVLLQNSWFRGSSYSGLRNALSATLRTGQVILASSVSSSISLPTNSGFTILGLPQYLYIQELLTPDILSTNAFRTLFDSPDLGVINVFGDNVSYTQTASGTILLDVTGSNQFIKPLASWRLEYWNTSGNELIFTTNMPIVDTLKIFISNEVSANVPTPSSARQAWLKDSKSLYWSDLPITYDPMQGLASFA